jgi:hypothetical protein
MCTSGESVELHCQFSVKENHRAIWLKDGVPLEVLNNLHYSLFNKHSLLIKGKVLSSSFNNNKCSDDIK